MTVIGVTVANAGGLDPHEADLVLFAEARDGDDDAFRRLVERHRGRIYRFLLKHAITSAEAEELTQDVFLQAYLGLRSFDGRSRLLSWLTGIALNLVRNCTTRSPWRLMELGMDVLPVGSDTAGSSDSIHGGNPEFAAAFSAALAALASCLGELPADARESLMLVGLEGLSYDEAAAVLGEPVGSIKSRVSRSRKQLRESLPAAHFDVLAGRL
ncbi:RNA polymerase sigma factor [Caenimonas terrae]|uniref:RNA polymerase sigma factor n=1 Tax=Caenimonas terrae TaxID=696074 RepID=A0ABW0NAB1_9BURK